MRTSAHPTGRSTRRNFIPRWALDYPQVLERAKVDIDYRLRVMNATWGDERALLIVEAEA